MAEEGDDRPLLSAAVDNEEESVAPVSQQPTGASAAQPTAFSFDDVVSGIFVVSFDPHKGRAGRRLLKRYTYCKLQSSQRFSGQEWTQF